MSQKFENLSALVDGEQPTSGSSKLNSLDALKDDLELQQKWQNYHVIRDSLRKELPNRLNFDISENVLQALASEPAILAPKRTWRALPLVGNVVPFAKQGGQMAIAASVAVAMIIGVQQLNQSDTVKPFNAAPPIPGIQGGLSPVSFDQTRDIPSSNVVEQRRLINVYLADHKQQIRFKTTQSQGDEAITQETSGEESEVRADIVDSNPK